MRGTASRDPCRFCSIDAPDSIIAGSGAIFALVSASSGSASSASGDVPQWLWTLSHSEEVAVGFAMLLSTESAGERSWTAFFTTVVLVTVLLLPGPVSGAVTCEWVYVTKAKPTEMQKANWRAQRLSLLGRTDLLVISEGTLNE